MAYIYFRFASFLLYVKKFPEKWILAAVLGVRKKDDYVIRKMKMSIFQEVFQGNFF